MKAVEMIVEFLKGKESIEVKFSTYDIEVSNDFKLYSVVNLGKKIYISSNNKAFAITKCSITTVTVDAENDILYIELYNGGVVTITKDC